MDRVLVYGLKEPIGGVEQVAMNYIRNIVSRHELRFDLLVFGDSFSQEETYKQMGCRVLYVPVRRKNPVGYKKRIAQIFAENQYCAIWCNFSGLTNIDLLILGKKYRVPVRIAHSHASRLYWGSLLMKCVVPVLHGINSLRIKKYATDYWTCSDKAGVFMFPHDVQHRVIMIPNAVDTQRLRPDPEVRKEIRGMFGFDESTCVVGHVARLCAVKNQQFLLHVLKQMVCEKPDTKLLLIGDGELREELETLVDELRLRDHVIFAGARPDVPVLLQAMDVFVLPSFSEGLSLSAVEAQACGLPCVVSDGISRQTDVSGNVLFLPLDLGCAEWAQIIMSKAGTFTKNPQKELAERGYDIVSASDELCRRFLGEKL